MSKPERRHQIPQSGLRSRFHHQAAHPIVLPAAQKRVRILIAHRLNQFVRKFTANELDQFLHTEHAVLEDEILAAHHQDDARQRMDAGAAQQSVLATVTRIDGGEIDAERFQCVDHALERGRRFHARETPVGVEHEDVERRLAVGQHRRLVVLGGYGEFVENADVLVEVKSVAVKTNPS